MNIVSILNNKSYRISVFTLTSLLILGIFYITLGTKPRLDPAPDIKPLTPEKYNEWGQYSDVLNLGVYIRNLGISDFSQGLFMVDAFFWVQFNPRVFSIDTVGSFSIDKGKILEKEFIESIKVKEDLFVRYRVRFEVKSNLNFRYYPLDGHRVYFSIKYENLAPSEVSLVTTYSRTWFGYNAVSTNWRYGEPACNYGYIESDLDTRDKKNLVRTTAATIYFDLERATLREAYVVLGPYLVMLLIILGALLMALTGYQMGIVVIMGILGMILHRIVVAHMSAITSYFLLSDCVFYLALICALLVLVMEIISAMNKHEEEMFAFEAMRGATLTIVSLIFLVGWFYLLYIW